MPKKYSRKRGRKLLSGLKQLRKSHMISRKDFNVTRRRIRHWYFK